jgi:hypothetical protein
MSLRVLQREASMRETGLVAAAAVGLCVAMSGCGSDSQSGGVDKGAWAYPEHQFVVDDLRLPLSAADSQSLGFDLDHNGTVDNRLGDMLVALQGAMSGTSPQDSVDAALLDGSLIVLLTVYAQSLDDSGSANAWAFVGQSQALTAGPQPGMTVTVDPAGPQNAYFGGRVKTGVGYFGGDDAALVLRTPFTDYGTLDLPLKAVRMEFDVSADGLSLENARVGGAVSESDMQATVLPQIASLLDSVLVENCTARGGAGGDGTCGCITGSGTATIQNLFDSDGDCYVTADEVKTNSLLATLLEGDVTLDDGSKALSLSVGFHAIGATFTHPSPPAD